MSDSLMIVDMQQNFLKASSGSLIASQVPRLVDNICDRISDALHGGEELFFVEFEGNGNTHPKISKALNGKWKRILKNRPWFPILERNRQPYWVTYDVLEEIRSIELCWVNTLYCVRDVYDTLTNAWKQCSLFLWWTINTCHDYTTISKVEHYYGMKWLSVDFTWRQQWKKLLEDYL